MRKFKVGDRVITRRFDNKSDGCIWMTPMVYFLNKSGIITETDHGFSEPQYEVHDWFWPESSLELVDSASSVTIQTSAKGISVVISPDKVAIMEDDCMVVDFTQQEVTEIFTAMKAFK